MLLLASLDDGFLGPLVRSEDDPNPARTRLQAARFQVELAKSNPKFEQYRTALDMETEHDIPTLLPADVPSYGKTLLTLVIPHSLT